MKFTDALLNHETILENGPLGTRLKYEYGITSLADLSENQNKKIALSQLYEGDLEIANRNNLPIILNAATFRMSKTHLSAAGYSTHNDLIRINTACFELVKALKLRHSTIDSPIFVGAPIGSMGDAYSVDNFPTISEAAEYHREQIAIFEANDVDFINAVTLPSLSEALGISLVAEKTNLDYTIGFILNKTGTLLDGTPLIDAIEKIDSSSHIKKPLGYFITCTHASITSKLDINSTRIIGLQLNGSHLPMNDLANSKTAISDTPERFTADLISLKEKFGANIIGGCCGTTRAHLKCIAEMLKHK